MSDPINFILTNTASVAANPPIDPGPDPHPNTVILPTNGESDVVLTVTKTILNPASPPYYAGNPLTYRIVVKNNSTNHKATNVVLTDLLPTFVSSTPAPSTTPPPPPAAQNYTWNIGELAANTEYIVDITINTADDAASIVNTGQVQWKTTGQSETLPFTLTTDLAAQADLGITKILVSPSVPVHPGDTLHYLITVHNYGPSMAKNVIVTDTLPDNVAFISATPSPSTIPPQPYTWNLGNLHSGSDVPIDLYVQVNE